MTISSSSSCGVGNGETGALSIAAEATTTMEVRAAYTGK